jgi:hypothetical protein
VLMIFQAVAAVLLVGGALLFIVGILFDIPYRLRKMAGYFRRGEGVEMTLNQMFVNQGEEGREGSDYMKASHPIQSRKR